MFARLFIIALSIAASQSASTPLHVQVSQGRLDSSLCAFWGDAMVLTISDDHRRLMTKHYCSAYGRGSAYLVTDARGNSYVFWARAFQHGTHVTTDLLSIYRFDRRMKKRAQLPARVPLSWSTYANYRYKIRKPQSGGLVLIGSLKLDGKAQPGDDWPDPAPRVSIDVGPGG
jgi:hypothetical protein